MLEIHTYTTISNDYFDRFDLQLQNTRWKTHNDGKPSAGNGLISN